MFSPSFSVQVDAFRERITSEAEDLVASFFPKKLLELDCFLKEPLLNIQDLATIHSDLNLPVPEPIVLSNSHDGLDSAHNAKKRKLEDNESNCSGTKVFVMPNGMLKSNQQLVEMIEKIKPEIRTLMEKCNTVKMWVQLLIPRIEDGNNFGVSIQVQGCSGDQRFAGSNPQVGDVPVGSGCGQLCRLQLHAVTAFRSVSCEGL
uniref:Proteasome activator complex subunit 3 n=1 Tax=Callorhinchus milii TaxID=7868 RepID=A0A4W3H7Y4_CALMI